MSMLDFFEHIESPALPRIAETQCEGRRWYETPGGCYPSMTTVLGWHKEGDGKLAAWRERVGEVEAERIASESRAAGNEMHGQVEAFLRGFPMMPESERGRNLLRSMLPALMRIDRVRHLETALYSDELRVAGRCDCIAEFDGQLAVIDFKNSLKKKKREWITDYFLQVTGYAEMYRERTGTPVHKGVVLVAAVGLPVQVFEIETGGYVFDMAQIAESFHDARSGMRG